MDFFFPKLVFVVQYTIQQFRSIRTKMQRKYYHNFFIPPAHQYNNYESFSIITSQGFQNPNIRINNNVNGFPNNYINQNNNNNFNNNNQFNKNSYINNNNKNNNNNNHAYNNHISGQNNFNNNVGNFNSEEKIFKEPEHLRGLVNIASTCYMNSTLQCFAHIKELFLYFQKDKMIILIDAPENKDKLFTIFAQLINCMWFPYDTTPLYPYKFKERLGQLNPLFQGAMPNMMN